MKGKRQKKSVKQAMTLFGLARDLEKSRDVAGALKFERDLAALVEQVRAKAPDSEELADVLSFHEYTLLSLSRTSKDRAEKKSFKDRAYTIAGEAVDIRLKDKPSLGTGFAAYNLAIDLIVSEKRPEEGLKYMLAARKVLKSLKKKEMPRGFDFFMIEYGIAKAHADLGSHDKAVKVLKRGLKPTKLLKNFDSWSVLRAIAKCAQLMGDLRLKERMAESADEHKAAQKKYKKKLAKDKKKYAEKEKAKEQAK